MRLTSNFGFQRLDGSNALDGSGVRGHFFGQSSFATHALATKHNLVKVPKILPLELLAPLGCGLQTGAGTVLNSLAVKAGRSLAVLGAGSVGLAAIMAARIARARTIIAVNLKPVLRCNQAHPHIQNPFSPPQPQVPINVHVLRDRTPVTWQDDGDDDCRISIESWSTRLAAVGHFGLVASFGGADLADRKLASLRSEDYMVVSKLEPE